MILRDGNHALVMLASRYFASEEDEPKLAQQLGEAAAEREGGKLNRVWEDTKAGGWFASITVEKSGESQD